MKKAVLAVALLVALAGCGGGPSDEEKVRQTLTDFGKATSAKDYQTLCDKLLAPDLVDKLKQVGLPCEVALEKSLGNVKNPQITIGKITINGKLAKADVRTSAAGEQPSQDTVELVPVGDTWRISSLG